MNAIDGNEVYIEPFFMVRKAYITFIDKKILKVIEKMFLIYGILTSSVQILSILEIVQGK